MSIWDTPGMNTSGEYVTFTNIGDTISGTIANLRIHKWDDGNTSPQITLTTGDGEKTVTAGPIRLKLALAEHRPEIGDHITITLTDIEKRAQGRTLKHFTVHVIRAGQPAPPPVPAPPVPPQPAPPVPPQPALGGLTETQLAALRAAGLMN
jgi:hypothetical protein